MSSSLHHLRVRVLAIALAHVVFAWNCKALSKTVSFVSEAICFSHLECPVGSYCKKTDPKDGIFSTRVCAPRGALGATCEAYDAFACQDGLYCPFRQYQLISKCARLPGAGMKCNNRIAISCAPGLRCTRNGFCRDAKKTGAIGTPCSSDFSCAIENGLACDLFTNKCVRRKPRGARCLVDTREYGSPPKRIRSQDCIGYCKENGLYTRVGTCASRRASGQTCGSAAQCASANQVAQYREDPLLCNRGKCVPESKILKRLGEPCETGVDRCDMRRELRCMWSAVRKRMVCQQRGKFYDYCTPGTPFSTCVGVGEDGRPLECRVDRGMRGNVNDMRDRRYFRCLQRSRPAVLGGPCAFGIDKCPAGSACRRVPYFKSSDRRRVPDNLIHVACMRLLPVGADCTKNRLQSICGDDLKCGAGGKCVKGKEDFKQKPIRAGLYSSCTETLPCAPGMVCFGSDKNRRFCEVETVPVGLGEICGYEIRKICRKGLICSQREVRRCIKKPKRRFPFAGR